MVMTNLGILSKFVKPLIKPAAGVAGSAAIGGNIAFGNLSKFVKLWITVAARGLECE